MEMEILIAAGCVLLAMVLFGIGLATSKESNAVQERISSLAADNTKKSPILRQKALHGSFTERVIFPFAQNIFDKTQRLIPLGNKSWVRAKLIQAGYLKNHYQKVFFGIQLLTTAVMFGFMLTITALSGSVPAVTGLVIAGIFGLIGYGLPVLWLWQQAQKRQMGIRKSLPDFLDLLVISVEAGLGLDMAISKLANLKSARTSTYLREELVRYAKDISLGKPRKEALLDMANRTGVDEFLVIINALVQSYEMGTGVSQTLRVQADSLRIKRLQAAEERANKVPVKMVMPIYMFLFPAIFVSIFGPIAMVVIEAIFNILDGFQLGG